MKMNRAGLLRVAIYAGSLVLLLSAGLSWRPSVAARPSAGDLPVVPYAVTLKETVKDKNGQYEASLQTWALRADGARVLVVGPDPTKGSRQIILPGGVRVVTNEATRRKTTDVIPELTQWPVRLPSRNCVLPNSNERAEGVETRSGRSAIRVREKKPRDSVAWFALDASCAPLGRIWVFQSGTSELQVESFALGEPSPSLFALDADLLEGPPSLLASDKPADCSKDCLDIQKTYFDTRDKRYFERRAGK